MSERFREAADQAAIPQPGNEWEGRSKSNGAGFRADVETKIGGRLGAGAGAFLDSLLFNLIGEGPRPYRPGPAEADLLRAAANDTVKREQRERDEADAEWRKRQRSPYGE